MTVIAMAANLRHALDPVTFAAERLGFTPDPWQARMMRSGSKRILLNCSRQAGKSTATAVIALHTAVYRPRSLVLLVSPTDRQSAELFAKVSSFMKMLEPAPPMVEDNKRSFTLVNGSRVICLPGSADTVRGFSSPALVIEDEAAYVGDDLYIAVRPMLAVSDGRLIMMSTPHGKRGHFFESWIGAENWQRIEIKGVEVPRITAAFLAQERAAIGDLWFRQEYECEFVDTIDQMFRSEDINRAMSADVRPLFGQPAAAGRAVSTTISPLFHGATS